MAASMISAIRNLYHLREHFRKMSNQVIIYVYGSCHFSERTEGDEAVGNGGYGVVISSNGQRIQETCGGFSNTTNARMDILGITEGLKRIKEPSEIVVYLTNGYVIDTLSKGWLQKWKKDGYKKKKHVDLWKKLDSVLQENSHNITFKHSRDVQHSADFQYAELLGRTLSGRKNLPKETELDNGLTIDLFDSAQQSSNNQIDSLELEDDKPILDGVCVDASCIGNPGKMEYRGVDMKTGKLIFEMKYEEATNNIGEFLAIVHALALYKKNGKELKIVYSDSLYAISWVKQKKCKTNLERSEKNKIVFEHIRRAEAWLNNNEYDTKVLKWNTHAWGEIPADYGRK
jgi:ribonuclease HI